LLDETAIAESVRRGVAEEMDIPMERVLINGISSGSVIVDLTVVWTPDYDLDLATQSVNAFEEKISTGNLAFSMTGTGGNTIQVPLREIDNVTHRDTASTTTTTAAEEEEEEESDPTVLIIVLSTTIPGALILILMAVSCCVCRKKARVAKQVATPTAVRYASILRTV
jgi:hypothetical protein